MPTVKEYTIDEWLDFELYRQGKIAVDLNSNYVMLENLQDEINRHTKMMNNYGNRGGASCYHLSAVNKAKDGFIIYAKERIAIKDQIKVEA